MPTHLPPPDLLRKLLRYEPETGKLFWRYRPLCMFKGEKWFKMWNARYEGKEAFTADDGRGYLRGSIFDKQYKAHHIAWAMHYGSHHKGEIDHINHNKSDNRICNLRDVTHEQNTKNKPMQKNNKSGHTGVWWNKSEKKWRAVVGFNNKKIYVGSYARIEDAVNARSKKIKDCGFNENHGIAQKP